MPSLTPRYPFLVTMAALYTIRSHQYNVWKSIWTVSNVRLPLTKCLSQTLLQLINKKSPLKLILFTFLVLQSLLHSLFLLQRLVSTNILRYYFFARIWQRSQVSGEELQAAEANSSVMFSEMGSHWQSGGTSLSSWLRKHPCVDSFGRYKKYLVNTKKYLVDTKNTQQIQKIFGRY